MNIVQKNRIRKSTKYICIIFSIIIIVTSVFSIISSLSKENIKTRTKNIYQYRNKFSYDYKVNLRKNKYINNNVDVSNVQAYVTDLMDTIDLNLKYEYLADKESELNYKYSVIGKTQVFYVKDGNEQKIWEEEETLLEEQSNVNTGSSIELNEKIVLDLKSKNSLINDFKKEMGMTVNAIYTVELRLNLNTEIEGKQVDVNLNPNVQIELAEKTSRITGENNKEDTQYISKEYKVNSKKNLCVILSDMLAILVAFAILKYVAKSRVTNTIKDDFRQELNRILKVCDDKIVQISTKPIDNDDNVVLVKDFGEIVKVSEELFKPILYYYDIDNEEASFSVVSGQTSYRFILKK